MNVTFYWREPVAASGLVGEDFGYCLVYVVGLCWINYHISFDGLLDGVLGVQASTGETG